MNEIVWVCGASGAGKETFITTVTAEKPLAVIKEFGWDDKNIIPCRESIEYVVQSDNDGNAERRSHLPEIIRTLDAHATNSVILIKGQNIDLEADRIRQTKLLIPHSKHWILFITVPLDQEYERLQHKKWWKKIYTKTQVLEREHYQEHLLKNLQKEFQIRTIDNSYQIAIPTI